MLSDKNFFRAHKSFLVNLAHVKTYRKGEGGTVVMSDGQEIEVSRRNKEAFIKIFKP
jgi:two-component system LytT family response regulator